MPRFTKYSLTVYIPYKAICIVHISASFVVVEPTCRRKGMGVEALQLMMSYGKDIVIFRFFMRMVCF